MEIMIIIMGFSDLCDNLFLMFVHSLSSLETSSQTISCWMSKVSMFGLCAPDINISPTKQTGNIVSHSSSYPNPSHQLKQSPCSSLSFPCHFSLACSTSPQWAVLYQWSISPHYFIFFFFAVHAIPMLSAPLSVCPAVYTINMSIMHLSFSESVY